MGHPGRRLPQGEMISQQCGKEKKSDEKILELEKQEDPESGFR